MLEILISIIVFLISAPIFINKLYAFRFIFIAVSPQHLKFLLPAALKTVHSCRQKKENVKQKQEHYSISYAEMTAVSKRRSVSHKDHSLFTRTIGQCGGHYLHRRVRDFRDDHARPRGYGEGIRMPARLRWQWSYHKMEESNMVKRC
jgi:hypothetical protein